LDEVVNTIRGKAHPDVHIIHGVTEVPELGDNIRVTVIATGFQAEREKKASVEGEKLKNGDFIPIKVWEGFRERSKQPALPSRGAYSEDEDLDIPAAIRNFNFMSDNSLSGKANEG
jgi:cell division GTPase FtsZ